jgi:hypothetical protein
MFVRPAVTLLIASLAVSAPARADEAEDQPKDGGLAESIGRWLAREPRQALEKLGEAGVYPIASGFAQGTGPAPGLTLFQPRALGMPLDVMVAGARSFYGDSFQEIRVGRMLYEPGRAPTRRDSLESLAPALAAGASERSFFYAELRHREFGGGLVFDDLGGATAYRQDDTSLSLVAGHRLGSRWLVGMRAGTVTGSARLDASSDVRMMSMLTEGARERERYFRTSASLAFDGRDHPRLTARGTFLEMSLAHYQGRDGRASFNRLAFDVRRYQPLGSESRVLALRAAATLDSDTGLDSPFYLLETLGGDRLRSYDTYRFRSPRLASFSAEYRHALAANLQAVAFWDGGRAWGGSTVIGTNGFRSSYGLGLRLLSSERVLLRLEGARGAEGTRLHLGLGLAF